MRFVTQHGKPCMTKDFWWLTVDATRLKSEYIHRRSFWRNIWQKPERVEELWLETYRNKVRKVQNIEIDSFMWNAELYNIEVIIQHKWNSTEVQVLRSKEWWFAINKVNKRQIKLVHIQGFTRGKKLLSLQPEANGGGKSYGEGEKKMTWFIKDNIQWDYRFVQRWRMISRLGLCRPELW